MAFSVGRGRLVGSTDSIQEADQHRTREPAGVRVLRARVVRTPEQRATGPEGNDRAVGERPRGTLPAVHLGHDIADGIPSESAEGKDCPRLGERSELALEERCAVSPFLRGRAVVRRGASDGGREVEVPVVEAVVPPDRGGLIREPGLMERAYEERRGAVARKDPTGAVRPVGGRGEADHHETGRGVSEPRDRASPVLLVAELPLPLSSYPLAVPHQARAAGATDHIASHRFQRVGHAEGRARAYWRFRRGPGYLPVVTERDLSL